MNLLNQNTLLISTAWKTTFAGIVLPVSLVIYEGLNQNWLESFLFLLLLVVFLCYKKRSSSHMKQLYTLLDNISDAILTIDAKGIILSLNKSVEHHFGYQPSELLGQNINLLMPEPFKSQHDDYLSNYQKTGQVHILDKTREVTALRRNGEIFEAELWVHQLNFNDEIQFMGVIRDISERKHIDRIKTEFISTVSHELRTPLTSIRGSLGMLKSGILGEFSEKARHMIELAHNNTDRLINLVNDILDAEKIQAGKMELEFEIVNITELVKQSIEANETYAQSCHVSLQLDNNTPDFQVCADRYRLQQVMANLISNAAKFSPRNGMVTVTIKKQGDLVRVSVSDQGIGIPEQFRSQIFQKFSQVDSSDSRQKGGTGLGLNITQAIIEHHGGHIDYTTEEGKGSTFFFELLEYHEKSSSKPAPPKKTSQTTTILPDSQQNIKQRGHILVLEDETDIARLLSLLLEQQNVRVTTCSTAEEAKSLLKNNHYDGMTVDIRLPGQDGLSFIQEIRVQETDYCLPIIIVAAEADINQKTASSSTLNIIDWINKPIDTGRLNKALCLALKQSNAHSITVLHVEDNKDLTEMISGLLNDKINFVQVPTLQSAREKIATLRFDLVILDIGLPDGNGLDLIPVINQQNPLVPVIIFSARSVEQDIINQVDAALIKSKVSNAELVNTIKHLITSEGS